MLESGGERLDFSLIRDDVEAAVAALAARGVAPLRPIRDDGWGLTTELMPKRRRAFLSSDENGRRLIDAPGGMWCVQVGYGRAELGQAMAEQATKMAYFSPYSMSN